MRRGAVRTVGCRQPVNARLRDEVRRRYRLQLADRVREERNGGVLGRPAQCPVLGEELDVGDAAPVLLDVEVLCITPRELAPLALAHVAYLLAEAVAAHVVAQHIEPHGLEARTQFGRAGYGARV